MSEETQEPKNPQNQSVEQSEPVMDMGNVFLSYSLGINWTPEEREQRLKAQRDLLAKRKQDQTASQPEQQPNQPPSAAPNQNTSEPPDSDRTA